MRIISEKPLKEFIAENHRAKAAVKDWATKVRNANWSNFADVKETFHSVDAIGNQRYIFNINGNDYRIVAVIKFTLQLVLIRFIGTHAEYDHIDCGTI